MKLAALRALESGYVPLPVKAGSKAPAIAWKKYQTCRPSVEEVGLWLDNADTTRTNLGLVTGSISNLVVIDVDPRHGGDPTPYWGTTETIVKTPSGGFHFYYTVGGMESPKSAVNIRKGVDLRAEGGFVVAPPSTRDDGKYEWWGAAEPHRHFVAHDMPTYSESLHGASSARPEPQDSASTDHWISEALKGTKAGERNATCARLAGYLLAKHPRDVAWALVLSWTQRCSPPMDIEEAKKTFESIAANEEAKSDAKTAPVAAISVDDYLAANYSPAPRDWLVPGWVPCGSVLMLAGAPRSFKSLLTVDLCAAVAQGRPLPGRTTKQGPAILLQLEDPPYELAQRLAAALTLVPDCSDGDYSRPALASGVPLYVDKRALFRLGDKKAVKVLREQVALLRPALLIVDPFYLACDAGAASDYFAGMPQAIKLFASLRDEFGVTTVLVHHTRKQNKDRNGNAGNEDLTADDVYGSALVNAAVEGVILLKRTPQTNRVRMISNLKAGGADLEPHEFEIMYNGASPLLFQEYGGSAGNGTGMGASPAGTLVTVKPALLELCLQLLGQGVHDVRTMAERTKASRNEISNALEILLLQRKVKKAGRGKYALPG